jgi:hypothetical protein
MPIEREEPTGAIIPHPKLFGGPKTNRRVTPIWKVWSVNIEAT